MPAPGVSEESSGDMPPKVAWQLQQQQQEKVPIPQEPSKAVAEEDRISMSRRIIFAAPTVATLPFVAMWGMYGNKSYQAFGASLAIIALFTALARSLDVVSDPLISYLSDSARFDQLRLPGWLMGRRKPFMFVGCFFYSGFLWLLLNPPYTSENKLALWFGCFYTLYFLANTITCIPYDALGPELSEDSGQRTGLFFVSNLFDGVGTLIALGMPIVMTSFAAKQWHDRNDEVCLSDMDRAVHCLAGRSCINFLVQGHPAAYLPDASLASILSNVTSALVTADPGRDCGTFLRGAPANFSVILPSATFEENDAFCQCMNTCADGCSVANKRTGFMIVGTIFAIWFTFSMVTTVCRVPERKLSAYQAPPPIVPSVRNALNNKPFRVLLPAWLCDAFVNAIVQSLVPYFVEGVIAPAYQTMEHNSRDCHRSSPDFVKDGRHWHGEAGRSDSPTYDRFCDTDNVIAISGLLALVMAILFLPLWNFLVRKFGKVQTWLVWTLTMAATNLIFVFLPKGSIYMLWVTSAINGAPLGAKFLADSILADIIDYDEFCTGARSEATYFMFKSFLPKIVQIPAAAIPIALLGSFNYSPPLGGKVQDQPLSVAIYLRCMIGMGFVVSVCAFFLKRKYPLRDNKVDQLAQSLNIHKEGRWAMDPLTKLKFKPLSVAPEEQDLVYLLCHFNRFSTVRIRETFKGNLPMSDDAVQARLGELIVSIKKTSLRQILTAALFMMVAVVGTGSTITLLWSEKLQFVPTLFVVGIGIGISSSVFTVIRKRAADRLCHLFEKETETLVQAVQHLLDYQRTLELYGHANTQTIQSAFGGGNQASVKPKEETSGEKVPLPAGRET